MFDQQLRAPFWRRHPVVTAVGLALSWLALIHGWYLPVTLAAAGLTLFVVRRHLRDAERRRAALRARADFEYRLNLAGDPRGVYGRYPPVQPGWFRDPGPGRQWRYFDGAVWTGHTAPR